MKRFLLVTAFVFTAHSSWAFPDGQLAESYKKVVDSLPNHVAAVLKEKARTVKNPDDFFLGLGFTRLPSPDQAGSACLERRSSGNTDGVLAVIACQDQVKRNWEVYLEEYFHGVRIARVYFFADNAYSTGRSLLSLERAAEHFARFIGADGKLDVLRVAGNAESLLFAQRKQFFEYVEDAQELRAKLESLGFFVLGDTLGAYAGRRFGEGAILKMQLNPRCEWVSFGGVHSFWGHEESEALTLSIPVDGESTTLPPLLGRVESISDLKQKTDGYKDLEKIVAELEARYGKPVSVPIKKPCFQTQMSSCF